MSESGSKVYVTAEGHRVLAKTGEAPTCTVIEGHSHHYLIGFGWIKSRQAFSGNCNLHHSRGGFTAEQVAP